MRRRGPLLITTAAALLLGNVALAAPAAADVAPINPVTLSQTPPANGGFHVFVEQDTFVASDESEGPLATGGDFSFADNYNISFQGPFDPADGVGLLVGGDVVWPAPGEPGSGSVIRVLQGLVRIGGDAGGYTALDRDMNNAVVNLRVVAPGAGYDTTPRIEGGAQSAASVADPTPSVDFVGAYEQYRALSTELAACPVNTRVLDGNGDPLTRPVPPGTNARVQLVPGETNFLTVAAEDLTEIQSVLFEPVPSADTPLVINILGDDLDGSLPQLAGVSGAQAPYMLWNLPEATRATYRGVGTIEGTLYAPFADFTWAANVNLQGNVVAQNFSHVRGGVGPAPRELHNFPFATEVSCGDGATLTLVKEVVNDDGGTATVEDWTLFAHGTSTISGTSGSEDVTDVALAPGTYTLSESGDVDGYEAGEWSCEGGVLEGDELTIALGDDVVCTIVNTYVPDEPEPTDPPLPPLPGPDPSDDPSGDPSDDPTDDGGEELAASGASPEQGLLVALLLVGLGTAAVLLARRDAR